MDLDAYVYTHRHEWDRLDALAKQARLSGSECDELLEHYQRVSMHLSVIRTSAPDADAVSYLSSLLARARIRLVGSRTTGWRHIGKFFTRRFPAALYQLRWWWLFTMAANIVVGGALMVWFYYHPRFEQSLMPPGQIDQLVENDFASYYTEYASEVFATQVWVNNAWVAAFCIALGTFGLPVIYLLWNNVFNLAVIGAIMHRYEHGWEFWGLLLPHGLLELTAVFVAAGVGFRLFWSWVSPGEVSRASSFASAGRTAITVAMGLVMVLFLSGLVEGFVTGSALPTWARLGIGAIAELLFFAYVFGVGRRAVAAGETGDVDAALLEDARVTAA